MNALKISTAAHFTILVTTTFLATACGPTRFGKHWTATAVFKIKASAKKLGLVVELPDCLIASIALPLDLPLVTGNTPDFESIRKTGAFLALQNWRHD